MNIRIGGAANGHPDGFLRCFYNSKSSTNYIGPLPGQDAEMDSLTEQQARATDPAQMLKLWNQILDGLYDQEYQVPIGTPVMFRAYQPWVENMASDNCAWRMGLALRGAEEDWFNTKAPKR